MTKRREFGKIIIPYGTDIWRHELKTADALAGSGHTVEFLIANRVRYAKSPDVLIDGHKWEMKSPKQINSRL